MKRAIIIIIVSAIILFALFYVQGVKADNGIDEAPPQLESYEATRWINALPTARPYLARLYEVPKDVAIQYGAVYETPTCVGVNAGASVGTDYMQNETRWEIEVKPIEDAPQGYDITQAFRWAHVYPWNKKYIEKLYK